MNNPLVPVDTRQVDFHGDTITAALAEGEVYVPLRPICDYLGLNWSAQLRRIKRDPVLSEVQGVVIMDTPQGGGSQPMACLPLKFLNGWLFGVDASRVNPAFKEKILSYQRECYDVLSRAFLPGSGSDTELMAIRNMGLAIAQLAEEQMQTRREAERAHSRLDRAAALVGDIDRRLTVVESRVTGSQVITEAQAAEVQLAVKNLAGALSKVNGTNQYGLVYGEMYRKFGISSYKLIRVVDYEKVLKFLEEWMKEVEPG